MAADDPARLCVPMLFSEEYLAALAALNAAADAGVTVGEVYGCLPRSPVGSLRPASSLPQIDLADLRAYVARAHALGLEFDYTLNATVLDGAEHTSAGRRELVRFLEQVCEAGVDRFTVSIALLVRMLRTCFPQVKVSASITCEISSVLKGRRWVDLGVDRIVVSRDANRDFGALRAMAGALGASLELLVNSPCLLQCPDVAYHGNLSSLESGALREHCRKPPEAFPIPVLYCQRAKLADPGELVSSPWIRPEDVGRYRTLGVRHFKLDGRDRSPGYVLDVVASYLRGAFEGNLLYLAHSGVPRSSDPAADEWRRAPVPMAIDNRALAAFLDPFEDGRISCRGQCATCGYCRQVATRSFVCDERWRQAYLARWQESARERLDHLEWSPRVQ